MNDSDISILYTHHREALLAYANYCCRDQAAAQDIVQQVFVKLLEKQDRIGVIDNPRAFLFILTRNETVDYLRQSKKNRQLVAEHTGRYSFTSHDALLEKEYRQLLHAAIEKLPQQQRLVYELRCVMNYKNEKVAAILELSPLTIKKHISEARKKLKQLVA